jgi:hypothetical protein
MVTRYLPNILEVVGYFLIVAVFVIAAIRTGRNRT